MWLLNYWCGYWTVGWLLNCCVVIELTKRLKLILLTAPVKYDFTRAQKNIGKQAKMQISKAMTLVALRHYSTSEVLMSLACTAVYAEPSARGRSNFTHALLVFLPCLEMKKKINKVKYNSISLQD